MYVYQNTDLLWRATQLSRIHFLHVHLNSSRVHQKIQHYQGYINEMGLSFFCRGLGMVVQAGVCIFVVAMEIMGIMGQHEWYVFLLRLDGCWGHLDVRRYIRATYVQHRGQQRNWVLYIFRDLRRHRQRSLAGPHSGNCVAPQRDWKLYIVNNCIPNEYIIYIYKRTNCKK